MNPVAERTGLPILRMSRLVTAVILPIFYAVMGFLFGVVGAWGYNIVSDFIGGIEVEGRGGMISRLRRLGCALGVLVVAGLDTGTAADHPAGIILYAEDADGVSLLLADHEPPSQRGWAAFGGTHEPGESPAETAARETEEETNGFFQRAALLAAIKKSPPLFDGPFAFYFVKVPKTPAAEIERGRAHPEDAAYRERGPYAWVPYAEIARQLDAPAPALDPHLLPAGARTNRLWPVWLHNLRIAIEARALPWEKARASTGGN